MKKKFLFSFLMFIFSFGIIYLLIFIYINLNLDKFLKYNIINKKNIINFYKEKSNTLHHLRDPNYVNTEKKNLEEYIFSYIEKNDSRETILFQGDSWFDQINFKKLYEKNINDTLRSVMWVPDFDPSNLTQWFSIRQDQQIFYKSELISKTKETKRQNKNANITPGQNRYEQQWWSYEF